MPKKKRTFGDVQGDIFKCCERLAELSTEFREMLRAHGDVVNYHGTTYLVERAHPLIPGRGHIRLYGRRHRRGGAGFCRPVQYIGLAKDCAIVSKFPDPGDLSTTPKNRRRT